MGARARGKTLAGMLHSCSLELRAASPAARGTKRSAFRAPLRRDGGRHVRGHADAAAELHPNCAPTSRDGAVHRPAQGRLDAHRANRPGARGRHREPPAGLSARPLAYDAPRNQSWVSLRSPLKGARSSSLAAAASVACARARSARAGANVVIASLPADSIPPVVAEAEGLGVKALGLTVDVTDEANVYGPADSLWSRARGTPSSGSTSCSIWLRRHLLTQRRNAPIPSRRPAGPRTPPDFVRAYDVNVKSAFLCARIVVPHM
jgi:hypothetical protein